MLETLRCEEARELIEPSLDGELEAMDETRLRRHLEACPSCAGERRLAVRIQEELRRLRLAEVVPLAQRRRPVRPARALLAAAMLALTVGGALVLEQLRVRPADRPSPAEVARATAEARFALAYVGKVSRQTGLDLRDGLLRGHLPPAPSVPADSGQAER
jgi:anti-sigma factor RsiW